MSNRFGGPVDLDEGRSASELSEILSEEVSSKSSASNTESSSYDSDSNMEGIQVMNLQAEDEGMEYMLEDMQEMIGMSDTLRGGEYTLEDMHEMRVMSDSLSGGELKTCKEDEICTSKIIPSANAVVREGFWRPFHRKKTRNKTKSSAHEPTESLTSSTVAVKDKPSQAETNGSSKVLKVGVPSEQQLKPVSILRNPRDKPSSVHNGLTSESRSAPAGKPTQSHSEAKSDSVKHNAASALDKGAKTEIIGTMPSSQQSQTISASESSGRSQEGKVQNSSNSHLTIQQARKQKRLSIGNSQAQLVGESENRAMPPPSSSKSMTGQPTKSKLPHIHRSRGQTSQQGIHQSPRQPMTTRAVEGSHSEADSSSRPGSSLSKPSRDACDSSHEQAVIDSTLSSASIYSMLLAIEKANQNPEGTTDPQKMETSAVSDSNAANPSNVSKKASSRGSRRRLFFSRNRRPSSVKGEETKPTAMENSSVSFTDSAALTIAALAVPWTGENNSAFAPEAAGRQSDKPDKTGSLLKPSRDIADGQTAASAADRSTASPAVRRSASGDIADEQRAASAADQTTASTAERRRLLGFRKSRSRLVDDPSTTPSSGDRSTASAADQTTASTTERRSFLGFRKSRSRLVDDPTTASSGDRSTASAAERRRLVGFRRAPSDTRPFGRKKWFFARKAHAQKHNVNQNESVALEDINASCDIHQGFSDVIEMLMGVFSCDYDSGEGSEVSSYEKKKKRRRRWKRRER